MTAPHDERVPDVERIAVLRANALGDFIFALPALEALRAAYPDAELVLLGAPWHARWVCGVSPVDRVLVVPALPGIRPAEEAEDGDPARELDAFLAAARKERFDLAVQLHGGGRNSNPIVGALGARVTAGLRAADAPPLDRWIRYIYYQPEVFRYLEVVGLVGAPPVTTTPRLRPTPAGVAEARRVAGEPAGRGRVALHPGANDPRRRWPAERFAEVADVLAGEGYEVIVTGTPGEATLVARVADAATARIRPLVGELSLDGLTGLYADCVLLVANDTGPLHLAAALGTPTVGVYWIGNLINGATPWRGRHRALPSWTTSCPRCGVDVTRDVFPARGAVRSCDHTDSFVTDVPTIEVIAAARDVLEPGTGPLSAQV